jgi:cell division protein FtsQ
MSGEVTYLNVSPGEEERPSVLTEDESPELPVEPHSDPPPAETHRGLEKGIKALIFAAAAVLVLELLWLLVISPCMPLSRIEITSFPGLERGEVLLRAGIGETASYISVNSRLAEKGLETIKEVESARVTRRFPNSLKILVIPRVAVAMAFTRIDGRQVPVYFDRHGIAFKTGGSARESLPVISGLPLAEDKPLSAMYLSLFASLDRIRFANPKLFGAVSEIRVNKKPFDGFDLVLYPVRNPIRVRLEPDLKEETLQYMMLMLDVLASKNPEIEEVDFRTGTASYTLKEASSG